MTFQKLQDQHTNFFEKAQRCGIFQIGRGLKEGHFLWMGGQRMRSSVFHCCGWKHRQAVENGDGWYTCPGYSPQVDLSRDQC